MSIRSGKRAVAPRSLGGALALLCLAGCSGSTGLLEPAVSPASSKAPAAQSRALPKGYAVLYAFKGSPDGATPYGGVIAGSSKGTLIGTTYYGGTSAPPTNGAGTVFALTKSGDGYTESVIHDFGHDGYYPSTGPTLDPSGNLYATMQSGPSGAGSSGGVICLTPGSDGYDETGVFQFGGSNGSAPGSQLVEINDGSARGPAPGIIGPNLFYGTLLYTTTSSGGSAGYGSLAALTLALSFTDDYDFQGPSADGSAPTGNLEMDMSRNLDGTTSTGGMGPKPGYGTVFQYDPSSGSETVLHEFAGGTGDGSFPTGGVVLDNEGNIYGTTQTGGAYGKGTIFKLTNTGGKFSESILHSFGGKGDGATPFATMVVTVSSEELYGTTNAGGANGLGTIFQIATNGTKYKTLYSFAKSSGASPGYGSLLLEGNALYGTTMSGGASNVGVVYRFVP